MHPCFSLSFLLLFNGFSKEERGGKYLLEFRRRKQAWLTLKKGDFLNLALQKRGRKRKKEMKKEVGIFFSPFSEKKTEFVHACLILGNRNHQIAKNVPACVCVCVFIHSSTRLSALMT